MAKNDVTVLLKHAVVLGAGDKTKTCPAGSVVKVPDELATHLVAIGAATPVAPIPEPAAPVSADLSSQA